jgi:ABC-type multidrug transport system ATPase subunit
MHRAASLVDDRDQQLRHDPKDLPMTSLPTTEMDQAGSGSPLDAPGTRPQAAAGTVLSARGLTKFYATGIWPRRRRVSVLRGADVELAPGELVGLVGENGSGKSTLMKILEELSGGTRAKLNFGLALLPDPQILLLDESYAGFDWDTYLRFSEITAARRDQGRSLLIISHFLTDEDRFDRVYDLRDGQTVRR